MEEQARAWIRGEASSGGDALDAWDEDAEVDESTAARNRDNVPYDTIERRIQSGLLVKVFGKKYLGYIIYTYKNENILLTRLIGNANSQDD